MIWSGAVATHFTCNENIPSSNWASAFAHIPCIYPFIYLETLS